MDDAEAIRLLERRIAQLEDLITSLRVGCTINGERVDHQEIYATLALTMRVAIPPGQSGVEQLGSSAGP